MSIAGALLFAFFRFASSAAGDERPLALVGVNVIPMDTERVLRDQTVLVSAGRIAAVGPMKDVAVPPQALRVEGAGRFLIPGLGDSHIHCVDAGDFFVYVANGVTTVRNLKGGPWWLELRERIERGELVGPRFFTAGPFVNEPEYVSPDDVRRAALEQSAAGYDCLKIHGDLALETYDALLEAADEKKLPVVGHVPRNLRIEDVLERGAQLEISHAEEYLYTYFDRLGPLEKEADADALEGIARRTAEARIAVTPNLVAYRSIVRQIEDLRRELARPEMAWVAPAGRRGWQPDLNRYEQRFDPEDAPAMQARYELLERFTLALQKAGVRLLAGSDAMNPAAIPGFSLHEELELLVAAGLTPFEALRAATANLGSFLGSGAGVVLPGAPADLVLLAENPLEKIERTRGIEGVLLRGRWFAKDELERGMQELSRAYAREDSVVSKIDVDEIEPALQRLAELRASDPDAPVFRPEGLESLVIVYRAIGRPELALRAAELGVEEFEERWTLWARLAEQLAANKDRAGAREAWKRALDLQPGNARLQRALAELEGETQSAR